MGQVGTLHRPLGAGRHADPPLHPRDDPRLKPELLAALGAVGLADLAASPSVCRGDTVEAHDEYLARAHAAFNGLYEMLDDALPGDRADVSQEHATVTGVDGNAIDLRVYRAPDAKSSAVVLYLHGGGMTLLDAFNKVHRRWCEDLAVAGLTVIGVDFRNAYTAAGRNPFPAGLNDCASAVRWIGEHRAELGVDKLVLQGESGGANLALATAIKAKQDGHLELIDGVYASAPYISGAYGWDRERRLRELPSLVEYDGYFLDNIGSDLCVWAYDPDGSHATAPLCWPYFAGADDLRGLPPHVVTVDELDPLRDEGIAYYRTLLSAGVSAVGRVNLGLTHAATLIFRQALAADRAAAIADISRFSRSL